MDAIRKFILKIKKGRALKAVAKCGTDLKKYPEFQQDQKVVYTAVLTDSDALEFAHPTFQTDEYIALAMIQKFEVKGTKFISPKLLQNPDFLYKSLYIIEPKFLLNIKSPILDDKENLFRILKTYPETLSYISPRLKKDADLVLMAVSSKGAILKYADPSFRANLHIGLVALSDDIWVFDILDDKIKKLILRIQEQHQLPHYSKTAQHLLDNFQMAICAYESEGLSALIEDGSNKKNYNKNKL